MQLRQSLPQLLTTSNQQPSSIPAVLQCDTEHWLYQSVATLSAHALYQQLIVIIFLLTGFRNCTAYVTCVHLHKPCRLYWQKKDATETNTHTQHRTEGKQWAIHQHDSTHVDIKSRGWGEHQEQGVRGNLYRCAASPHTIIANKQVSKKLRRLGTMATYQRGKNLSSI